MSFEIKPDGYLNIKVRDTATINIAKIASATVESLIATNLNTSSVKLDSTGLTVSGKTKLNGLSYIGDKFYMKALVTNFVMPNEYGYTHLINPVDKNSIFTISGSVAFHDAGGNMSSLIHNGVTYVASYGYIYVSTDQITWSLAAYSGIGYIRKMLFEPVTGLIYAAGDYGLVKFDPNNLAAGATDVPVSAYGYSTAALATDGQGNILYVNGPSANYIDSTGVRSVGYTNYYDSATDLLYINGTWILTYLGNIYYSINAMDWNRSNYTQNPPYSIKGAVALKNDPSNTIYFHTYYGGSNPLLVSTDNGVTVSYATDQNGSFVFLPGYYRSTIKYDETTNKYWFYDVSSLYSSPDCISWTKELEFQSGIGTPSMVSSWSTGIVSGYKNIYDKFLEDEANVTVAQVILGTRTEYSLKHAFLDLQNQLMPVLPPTYIPYSE